MQYFQTQQKPYGCWTNDHAGFQSQQKHVVKAWHNADEALLVKNSQSNTYFDGFDKFSMLSPMALWEGRSSPVDSQTLVKTFSGKSIFLNVLILIESMVKNELDHNVLCFELAPPLHYICTKQTDAALMCRALDWNVFFNWRNTS